MRSTSVPFSYRLRDGSTVGYSVDICQRVAQSVAKARKISGLKVVAVPVESNDRIPKLLRKEIDIECGSTTLTRERQQKVDFSYPVFFSYMKIMSSRKAGIRTLADLKGKRVGVTAGSSGELQVRQWNSGKNLGIAAIQPVADHGGAMSLLAQGRIDAFVTDDVILQGLRATLPRPDDYLVSEAKLTVEPVALMLRKNDGELRTAVDAALKELMSSGELRQIYRKWFEQPIPPSGKALKMPMSSLLQETIRFPMDVPPAC